ncbi:non-ribosomal peptide synthetase [Mycobacteroides chelonae]|uniref:non-ribosomal peptide synthetase n=1 Tax=Mycobacteroides chelonae TaxID=1774 RepID=UPI000992161F|nr:non-ribosomal peptide synthetase [Mycobacteroides chelonae]
MTGGEMNAMDRRRELLRKRLADSGVSTQTADAHPRVQAGEHRPLAPGQRRMWFVQTKDSADTTLNVCVAHRLEGALIESRLRDAFAAVIDRHDILRTTYGRDGAGEPYQVFADGVELPWRTVDQSGVPADQRDAEVQALVNRECGHPFDLTSELPLRITLVRCNDHEFLLVLVVHHVCWDDSSWEVFFGDLNSYYNGHQLQGQAPQFAVVGMSTELPSDADFEYWRNALTPLPEPLELPGQATVEASRAALRHKVALPESVVSQVEGFAREHAASPFMVFLAGFGALMHRYTAAQDFLVAIPVTERKANAENVIGYFGNTLLLRTTAEAEDTFASYVASVRDVCLGAFRHQEVGIDRVVREINPSRAVGRDGLEALVSLGFSMRSDSSGYQLEGVRATALEFGANSAQLPLSMAIVADPSGTMVELEYQPDAVPDWLIAQLLTHFERLLDGGTANPHMALSQLDIFGEDERAVLLAHSRGVVAPVEATTIVEVLETACVASPDTIALASDTIEMTYRELHGRANRLARWLIGQGVGTEDVVALRMTTSVEFIVAMFAVLKAGAAYMPIDPGLPEERIEYLISDANPHMAFGVPEIVAAEREAEGLADSVITDSERVRPLRPDNLAYIIYTSGSTGQPKGVAVSHRAIAEHIVSFTAEWSMTAQDRMLQSTSVSFDASLADILCPLSLGARIVIPRANPFSDIGYVADLVQRQGVTVLHMVPSLLRSVMLLPEASRLRGLRHVPVGGEALPGEVADKFARVFNAELRNHYGPTEAVVCSTYMPVDGPQGTSVVPIGRPNRNVYAYVLDERLSLVPAGVAGELYLGGAQLARGYLGRASLSAARFVADPFGSGGRLYRTGDLVRRNASGDLEFIGRVDEQVKVRGYRIELGEVEAVITADERVGHCVVAVMEDPQIGPMLVAYVVPSGVDGAAADVDLDRLRSRAQEKLPAYMVPTAFVVIPTIPLTTSGKLDKRALPVPDPMSGKEFRAPQTPTERRMCAIFAHLFGRDAISADDSFFELGGHSLLAARLVAQIRAQFGIELTVRAVFDTPTPEGLAAELVEHFRDEFEIELDELDLDDEEMSDIAPRDGRPDLVQAVRPALLPLSSSQLSVWFECQMEGMTDFGNMSLVLRFSGPLNDGLLEKAINDVVARHEALRTNFRVHEGAPHQVVHESVQVSLPLTHVQPDELTGALNGLRHYVFDLESEPLIRPTLVRVDEHDHVLSIIVHHLVSDHSSFAVLVDDLIVAYRARLAGESPQWDVLPIQYADYVLWQYEAFAEGSDFAEAETKYWREQLAGVPGQIAVAHDRERPRVLGKSSTVHTFTLSPERRAAITRLAEQSGVTEFIVYQAAAATTLHLLGGGSDIVIGSPVASRVHPATANLIGLFANMVALRNEFSDNPTLRTVLSRSRDAVLNAQAHQELPFERLVEAINPPRSRSWNPLFQTMINFRAADWALSGRDLTGSGETSVVPLATELDVSYLDLNLGLNVTAEGGLDVWMVVNSDLYEPDTAPLIASAFANALDLFVSHQDSSVSEISLLSHDDMKRLLAPPAPAIEQPVEPRSAGTQETVSALIVILEELLEIDDVQPEDNFFALGGDSIISIQWSTRAAEQGYAMTPQMIFECPSISELAGAVDNAIVQPGDAEPTPESEASAPMSASGLSTDALAALTASWQEQS